MTGIGGFERRAVAEAIGEILELPPVVVVDEGLLRDALEMWASSKIHFVDAYLAALDRRTGGTAVLSFDRDFDKMDGVERVDPRTY